MFNYTIGIQEQNSEHNIFQGTNILDLDSGTFSKGKLASGKYQQLNNILSKTVPHASFNIPGNVFLKLCSSKNLFPLLTARHSKILT
jgi:hypothetical protein